MSGQTATFDPYHEWLGIHPSEQPADFYRLLGVCRFENNVAVIQGAYVQRHAYLQRFRGTPHQAYAEQLDQELLSAQTALLSPVLKSSYDAALVAAIQPPPAPQETAAPSEPNQLADSQPFHPAWEPDSVMRFDAPIRSTSRPKPRRQSNNPLFQLAGSLGGLILGFIILCFLRPEYDRFGFFHSLPVETQRKKQPKPEPPKQKPEGGEDSAGDTPQNPDPPRPPIHRPPLHPQPINPPVTPLPPIEIATQIELPARDSKDHVEVASLGTVDIAFHLHNPDGNPLQFQIKEGDDQQTWTITDGQNLVGQLKRENGRINFYWSDAVTEEAECLRNALLVLTVRDLEKQVRMRSARSEKAPAIDLELKGKSDKQTLPIDLGLYGLDASKLKFEVIGSLDGMTFQRFDPATKTADINQRVRAILRDQPPYAAFDVSITASGQVFAAKIWPLMAGPDKDTLPWTVDRVNTLSRSLNTKIAAAKRAIEELPQVISALTQQIAQLRKIPVTNPLYTPAQGELAVAEASLAQAQATLAEAQAALPVRQKQLEALKTLADLGNSISKKLRIQYRVFYVVGGKEVDVFRADDGQAVVEPPAKIPAEIDNPLPEKRPNRQPKSDKPIAIQLQRSLDTARGMLASRELEAAKELLDGLLFDQSDDEQRRRVDNAKALHHYIERFWNAVRESMKTIESGTDFAMGNSDRASVVEVSNDRERVTLRIRGKNTTYNVLGLPADVAVGLAEKWLARDDVNSKVFVAAFLAVESAENLGTAQQMLNRAKAAGSDAAQTVLDAIQD
jgi:hypothetical protein